MQRLLMILTSHRLDCLKLAIDLHVKADSFRKFDRVVFLLNGVAGAHLRYVERVMAEHPEVAWDTVSGPRGRNECISRLENDCVKRYPGMLYVKMDEDLFIAPGWLEKLMAAYDAFKDDANLALITPVIPNNAAGAFFLLNNDAALMADYRRLFPQPVVTDCAGPVWQYPQIAEWLTRKFLNTAEANAALERAAGTRNGKPFEKFTYRFSIGCILFDYRHWSQMGQIPKEDEATWTKWIEDNGKFNVLVTNALANHYSFFIQQDWLDRSTLLEDLRMANAPETLPSRQVLGYHWPRARRVFGQIPSILKRRLTPAAN